MEHNSFNSDRRDNNNNTLIQRQHMKCHLCYQYTARAWLLHTGNRLRIMFQRLRKPTKNRIMPKEELYNNSIPRAQYSHNSFLAIEQIYLKSARAIEVVFRGRVIFFEAWNKVFQRHY